MSVRNSNSINTIVTMIAMEDEAMGIISDPRWEKIDSAALKSLGFQPKLNIPVYRDTSLQDKNVYVVLNGKDHRFSTPWGTVVDRVSTVPAALVVSEIIRCLQPDVIISAGTCGALPTYTKENGVTSESQIGDVYIPNAPIVYADRGIAIPGFDRYGEGHFPHSRLHGLAEKAGLKEGTHATRAALDFDENVIENHHRLGVDIEDMEYAAILEAVNMLGFEGITIKLASVTNFLDKDQTSDFETNLKYARQTLQEKWTKVVYELLLEKTFEEVLDPKAEEIVTV